MIRVGVVDDHPVILEILQQYIESASGVECVGTATDGEQAIQLAQQFRPDVMLMDLNLPRRDGLSATYEITRSTEVRVLVFSALEAEEDVIRALHCGASGYMTKRSGSKEVIHALHRIHRGEIAFSQPVAELLEVKPSVRRDDIKSVLKRWTKGPHLAPRELSILKAACRGLTNGEIAAELVIAQSSVNTYISRIYEKLGANTRIEMYQAAIKHGLVPAPTTSVSSES
ncbi:response regulator [Nesterenkonia ebinurensis]|uniref:response regulator n=1 Tax=Nesterenkonia ebinurensis TaxID=2608252 RepID=UPI00123DCB1D|nr:response regulator transcription factor [Nesterenkonia ebinurensis]